jgi:hypothetical protein
LNMIVSNTLARPLATKMLARIKTSTNVVENKEPTKSSRAFLFLAIDLP